jgi:hypothetical protein
MDRQTKRCLFVLWIEFEDEERIVAATRQGQMRRNPGTEPLQEMTTEGIGGSPLHIQFPKMDWQTKRGLYLLWFKLDDEENALNKKLEKHTLFQFFMIT